MDLLKRPATTKKNDKSLVSRKESALKDLSRTRGKSLSVSLNKEEEDSQNDATNTNNTTINSSGNSQGHTIGNNTANSDLQHRYGLVSYNYTAQDETELTLEEGTIVTILPQCILDDKANFKMLIGFANGIKGIFPAECIKMLADDEVPTEEGKDYEPDLPTKELVSKDQEPKEAGKSNLKKNWFSRYVMTSSAPSEPTASTVTTAMKDSTKESTVIKDSTKEVAKDFVRESTKESPVVKESPLTNSLSSHNLQYLLSTSTDTTPGASPANTIKRINRIPGQRMLWADFIGGPDEVIKLDLSKQEIKRQEVIYEIITTESDYIQDLETVLEVKIILVLFLIFPFFSCISGLYKNQN